MRVIGVCSLKGGVGKTTVALGLAAAALRANLTTLVVDLDPQGDATYALGVEVGPGAVTTSGVADVLERPKRKVLEHSVVASPWGSAGRTLHVMPSGPATAMLDRPDAHGGSLRKLETALSKLDYDLVIIDAPPSLSALTRSALMASDRAIVVAEPGAFALNAATRMFAAMDDLRRREGAAVQPLGLVVNRYRSGLREHARVIGELQRLYGPLVLMPPIPERAAIQSAQARRIPLEGKGAQDPVAAAFDSLISRIGRVPGSRA